jgi:Fe-S-cluster containining protein
MNLETLNPCLNCGACCAYYRASFYWAECDDVLPGGVPVELTQDFNSFYRVMVGTDQKNPWCTALLGIIGKRVSCNIYERRASVCRDFDPSWQKGAHNERCDKARIRWGLEPLTPDCWYNPGDLPKAA